MCCVAVEFALVCLLRRFICVVFRCCFAIVCFVDVFRVMLICVVYVDVCCFALF